MLIARYSAYRYRNAVVIKLAYGFVARDYFRKRRTRNGEKRQKFVVVIERFQVYEHRSRSVGNVGYESLPAREFVYEKRIDRTEANLIFFKSFADNRNVVYKPFYFACRKVSVGQKPRLFT